jgi:hypothetical protein
MIEKGQSITICCCALGNLDFLKYLNNQGIKINEKLSFYWSAINGRLYCLKFLDSLGNEEVIENQFNTYTIELAERREEYECAKYLRENENSDNIDIYDMAIKEDLFENEEDMVNKFKNIFSGYKM